MKYERWTTADGRRIEVKKLTDIHLLNIIRAIEDGKVFPDYGTKVMVDIIGGNLDRFMPDVSMSYAASVEMEHKPEYDRHRDNWLVTLKGEALRRGLDWSQPPTSQVSIIAWVLGELERRDICTNASFAAHFAENILAEAGVGIPQMDVCNKTGKVTYLHWKTGEHVGTPLDR